MPDDSKRQLKTSQNQQIRQDDDLVDLPEQAPEPTWKQYLMTPKFLLLVVLTVGVVGRNIYLEYTKPPGENVKQSKPNNNKVPETEITEQMFSRFFWYIVLTIILFVVFILLKRSNDAAEEQKIRTEVKKQQEEAEKHKKIQERANRILTSMDQFGNVIDESAFKKKQSQPPQSQAQQKHETKKDK